MIGGNIVGISEKAFSKMWRFEDAKSAHDFFRRWNRKMEKMGRKSRVEYKIFGKKPTVMAIAHVERPGRRKLEKVI